MLVSCLAIFSLCVCVTFSINDPSLPAGLFYPFGEDEGDSVLPVGRFNFSEIQLVKPIAFDNDYYGKLNVEMHGVIAFGHRYEGDTPQPLPIIGDRLVAPYWAGADTSSNAGRVYYRQTDNEELLNRATQDFQRDLSDLEWLNSFIPQYLLIATWHNITFCRYGTASTPVNSFQAILAWNRKQSAISYRYGKLTWTTGGYSGGTASGLGGVQALMGYNSGNSEFFFSHEWSITADILRLVNSSNVGIVGRFSYRLDRLTNITDCYENDADADECPLPYTRYNEETGACDDYFAPEFGCPKLTGPWTIPDEGKFEFNCLIVNGSSNPQAVYDVTFTFNGQEDCSVLLACQERVSVTQGAKLTSDGLRGKNKMGKRIGCKVRSYFENTQDQKTRNLTSNEYFMGLVFSNTRVSVTEDELLPTTILVKSTVPITCLNNTSPPCKLKLKYSVINEDDGKSTVAFRQRHPSENPYKNGCEFTIEQADWKPDEQRAYNVQGSLEVLAKLDPYTTGPRTAWLTFYFDTADSAKSSIWYGYESSILEIHHIDVKVPNFVSIINYDPHFVTFDGEKYDVQCHGKYYYAVNNPGGIGLEVEVRHCPCWGNTTGEDNSIACVCGIAIREDTLILIADTCNDVRTIDYRSVEYFNKDYLCENDIGCGVFRGHTPSEFMLVTPSGNRVYGTMGGEPPSYSYINAQVVVNARFRNVTGFCGSPDGNRANDWVHQTDGSMYPIPIDGPWNKLPPKDYVDSWKRKEGISTLLDGAANVTLLPFIGENNKYDPHLLVNYCACTRDRNNGQTKRTCGGSAIAEATWPGDPKNLVPNKSPPFNTSADEKCFTWLPSHRCDPKKLKSVSYSWPTPKGITEEEANATCWSRIININNLGPNCYDMMMNDTETAQSIVSQCVADVQMTDEFAWADKINSVQKICFFDLISRNNSEMNDTTEAIELVISSLQEVTDFMCVPVDCNGHGNCINGTCNCTGDYVGSDCSVSRSAIPVIREVLSKAILDIRKDSSEAVDLHAIDVADTEDMTCKFETRMLNGVVKTHSNHGLVTSALTVLCKLPSEAMNYNSKGLDFTGLHAPGFNFSCLSPGSPAVTYTLSISNNGQTFSNSVVIKLYDSLCMDCASGSCVRVPNTCYINGYCFADQQPNPYMESCEVCDTATSDNSWTPAPAGSISCPDVWSCQVGEFCVPDLEFNYDCLPMSAIDSTTNFVDGSEETATTFSTSPSTSNSTENPPPECYYCSGHRMTSTLLGMLAVIVAFNNIN